MYDRELKPLFFVAGISILMLLVPNVYAGEDERDANPYCDLISDEDPRPQPCHDRKDLCKFDACDHYP